MDMTHHYNDYSSAVDCRTWWLNSPRLHKAQSYFLFSTRDDRFPNAAMIATQVRAITLKNTISFHESLANIPTND